MNDIIQLISLLIGKMGHSKGTWAREGIEAMNFLKGRGNGQNMIFILKEKSTGN